MFLQHAQFWKLGNIARIFPSLSWDSFSHVARLDQSRASKNMRWIIWCVFSYFILSKNNFFYSTGKNTPLEFNKKRKIPLLSEVINATKDDELVMYLNVSEFLYGPFAFSLSINHQLSFISDLVFDI